MLSPSNLAALEQKGVAGANWDEIEIEIEIRMGPAVVSFSYSGLYLCLEFLS